MKAIRWMLEISVCSLWAGFWACIGWDAARRLVPEIIPWLQEAFAR